MDYPAQDFASAGDPGDGETGSDGTVEPVVADNSAAVERLIAIFSETGRIVAKNRILFHGVRNGTGLTGSEALMLIEIVRAAEPCSVPQIGRSLGSPRQVVQRAIKVLERDGLIVPLPDKSHKRAPLLAPTELGRATIARIDAAAREIMAVMVASMPAASLDATHAGLVALREQIDRCIGVQED